MSLLSPLQTSKTAADLVDATLGNFAYLEEFPSIHESLEAAKGFKHFSTPPKIYSYASQPASCCASDVTPCDTPMSDFSIGHMELMDEDFEISKKRKELCNSNEEHSKNYQADPLKQKKPRLEWKLQQSFLHTEEAPL